MELMTKRLDAFLCHDLSRSISFEWPEQWALLGPSLQGGFPHARDAICLRLARPGRHCGADRDERLSAVAAELEIRAGWDADRDAGTDLDDLLVVAEFSPYAPVARDEIPHLFDRAMRHRLRDRIRGQRERREPTAGELA